MQRSAYKWKHRSWMALLMSASFLARAESADPAGQGRGQEETRQATGGFDAERWAKFVFPPLARMMLQWPDEIVLRGPSRVRVAGNREAATARDQSLRWIVNVIHRDWLPADPNALREEFVLIRDWHGRLDVTFVRWRKNNHEVQVAQSNVLFAIKVIPLVANEAPVALEGKTDYARRLCLRLFNQTYTCRTKVFQGVRDSIRKHSFSEALILEAAGTAIGAQGRLAIAAPWSMELGPTGRPSTTAQSCFPRKFGSWRCRCRAFAASEGLIFDG